MCKILLRTSCKPSLRHTMYYKGGGTLVDPLLLMHMKQQQQGTLWNLHPLLLFHLGILSIPVHQTVWKNNNKERKCPSRTLFFYWITCKEVGYYAQQTTHSVWWCTLWYYTHTHTHTRAYTTAATISTDLIRSILIVDGHDHIIVEQQVG